MTKTNMTSTIDELGQLKAQMAELARREKELKNLLIEVGPGAYEGELFRVTVSESARETLDMEAVREKLSPQFLRAHTRVTPVTTVRVTARNSAKLKIAS
jgi:hypothetical protein